MNLELNKDSLRMVAGSFATGVAVVTCRNSENSLEGITVNSFVSVSLEPPLILFSIQREATFLLHLAIGKSLGISILSEDQKPVSDFFAGMSKETELIGLDEFGQVDIISDAMGYYEVKVDQIIRTGDHDLVVCEIVKLGYRKGNPLLYYRGYKSIGEDIKS